MRRVKGFWGLVVLVAVAVGMLAYTFAVGNKPLLGLDLQGGVSVVLKPKDQVDADALDQAKQIIDNRVNALGVAEPEITRQGDNVLVQIAGVKDKDRALQLVGQTAELRFRPVLGVTGPPSTTQPSADQSTDTTVLPAGGTSDTGVPTTTAGSTDTAPAGAAPAGSGPTDTVQQQGMASGGAVQLGENAQGVATPQPSTDASTPSTAAGQSGATQSTPAQSPGATSTPSVVTNPAAGAATAQAPALSPDVCTAGVPPEQDQPDQPVVLPQCDLKTKELLAIYSLGPTALGGTTLETARATLDQSGQWVVNPVFKDGSGGIDEFNAVAQQCYSKAASCPTGQLAIVLDSNVISAPVIQEGSFQRDQIQISGSFNERTAKDLATALKYGALPVAFEVQQAQIVSATLGRDALHAGLIAGLVGLVIVGLYMLLWYRLLGALALLKLAVEGALLWSVISYLGSSAGLTLTLAGVTGIIVSIGVSLDSNVVYYEHLKEDVRHGRTIRSAADKAFVSSFNTIVSADVASLIGAFLLWWLTVGPVRGFAFYLGLSTLLDLMTSYVYMRPVVALATRGEAAHEHPGRFGLPREKAEDDMDSTATKTVARPKGTTKSKSVTGGRR